MYLLAGPDQITWPQLHDAVTRAVVNKPARPRDHWWQLFTIPFGAILMARRYAAPIPAWVGKFYAAIGIARLLGFNRDQVIMSQEDNSADITKFIDDFGWTPQPFEPALRSYASGL